MIYPTLLLLFASLAYAETNRNFTKSEYPRAVNLRQDDSPTVEGFRAGVTLTQFLWRRQNEDCFRIFGFPTLVNQEADLYFPPNAPAMSAVVFNEAARLAVKNELERIQNRCFSGTVTSDFEPSCAEGARDGIRIVNFLWELQNKNCNRIFSFPNQLKEAFDRYFPNDDPDVRVRASDQCAISAGENTLAKIQNECFEGGDAQDNNSSHCQEGIREGRVLIDFLWRRENKDCNRIFRFPHRVNEELDLYFPRAHPDWTVVAANLCARTAAQQAVERIQSVCFTEGSTIEEFEPSCANGDRDGRTYVQFLWRRENKDCDRIWSFPNTVSRGLNRYFTTDDPDPRVATSNKCARTAVERELQSIQAECFRM